MLLEALSQFAEHAVKNNSASSARPVVTAARLQTQVLAAASPLARYDRQAHIAWHEQQHPNFPNWPPVPTTDEEAAAAIAQYTSDNCDSNPEPADSDGGCRD